MQELAFQELPQQHKILIDSIENSTIQRIYSQFKFLFVQMPNLNNNCGNNKEDYIEKSDLNQDVFTNYLKNFKFISYHIQDINTTLFQNNIPKHKEEVKANSQFFDLVFCTEGICLIIHQINIINIKKIISELKKYQVSMINVGVKYNEDEISLQEEIKEEINNFCFHFKKEIIKNDFVKHTIPSLSGYLIRRFFYPTEYFKDPSFFSFDQMISKEQKLKKELKKVIFSNLDEIVDKNKNESNNSEEEEEEEEYKYEEIDNQGESFADINFEELDNFNENEEEEEVEEEEEEFNDSDDDGNDLILKAEKNNNKNDEDIDEKEIFDRSFVNNNNLTSINNEIFNSFYCNNDINVKQFQSDDFIILRTLYVNNLASFHLVIHIESLYIFMMKKFINTTGFSKEIDHEISFCENFSHRCFTPFYGFTKKLGNITGIIYGYMCNGDLYSYFKNNYEKIGEIFKITVINRIFQGIKFLYKNSLIHRDLKPSNILLDHDNIPYISDFETICQPSDKTMTADIGSFFFVSPEQTKFKSYSYPTDIYSFGQIIYFLYETNYFNNNCDRNLLKMKNGSKRIQELYESCVQNSPSERPTYEKITSILIKEVNSYYYFEEYFFNEKVKTQEFEIVQFFYEKMILLQLYKSLNKCCDQIYQFDYLYRLRKRNLKDFYFTIGYYFQIGKYVDENISKALKYYELSAKEGYILAYNNLGCLYKNGIGIKQDVLKAKEYFEKYILLSENIHYYHSYALFNLGLLENMEKAKCLSKKIKYCYKRHIFCKAGFLLKKL